MSIISTKYLLQDAQANAYAVPTFNIHNAETIQAILDVFDHLRHAASTASRSSRIVG